MYPWRVYVNAGNILEAKGAVDTMSIGMNIIYEF